MLQPGLFLCHLHLVDINGKYIRLAGIDLVDHCGHSHTSHVVASAPGEQSMLSINCASLLSAFLPVARCA